MKLPRHLEGNEGRAAEADQSVRALRLKFAHAVDVDLDAIRETVEIADQGLVLGRIEPEGADRHVIGKRRQD